MSECVPAELAGLLVPQALALGELWRVLWSERGVLIAWPLGSGKTWLACGLARLAARRAGLSTVIVAPARLLSMWRGVAASLGLSPLAVVSHRAASLGSLPLAATGVEARARLWVIDEAHVFRNPATRGHDALARAVAAGRVCLLTATPFNTSLGDVAALLALFGAVSSAQAGAGEVAAALGRVASFGAPAVPSSGVDEGAAVGVERRVLEVSPCADGRLVAWRAAVDALCAAPWPVFGEAVGAKVAQALVRDALLYRLLAHPVALLATLRRLRRYYARCRDPRGGELLDRATFARLFGLDGAVQGLLFFPDPPRSSAPAESAEPAAAAARHEKASLEALRSAVLSAIGRCESALRAAVLPWGSDPRLVALEGLLLERVGVPLRRFVLPEVAPVVCFAQSAEVARHVASELGGRGWAVGLVTGAEARLGGQRLDAAVLLGSLDPAARERALCQVLVCTDVLGQGHNLQRAQALVHLDRPWNPVRLAQREGRLVRRGQTAASVLVARLAVRPEHAALAGLERRLDAALRERRAGAAALVAGLQRPVGRTRGEELVGSRARGELVGSGTRGGELVGSGTRGDELVGSGTRGDELVGSPALAAADAGLGTALEGPGAGPGDGASLGLSAPAGLLVGALLDRVRPLRRHPDAAAWLGRIAALRRALSGALPTGTRRALDALLAGGLATAPQAALDEAEAALDAVLPARTRG